MTSTSTSTGTVTSYDWDFGDGSAHAAAATTQHQYSKGGVYHVTLTVGNSAGSSSVTHDVTVQSRSPVAGFTASSLDVMTGEGVDLHDGRLRQRRQPRCVVVGVRRRRGVQRPQPRPTPGPRAARTRSS
jgi:hypothetical protein